MIEASLYCSLEIYIDHMCDQLLNPVKSFIVDYKSWNPVCFSIFQYNIRSRDVLRGGWVKKETDTKEHS